MIDSRLYWVLPGPKRFVHKVATCIGNSRVLVVNMPSKTLPGTHDGVAQGLRDALVTEQLPLTIRGHMDIAEEIGSHFGDRRITPAHLAGQACPQATAVLLRAEDIKAQQQCERYALQFLEASKRHDGNVRLVTTLHDPKIQSDSSVEGVHAITFDGGLTPDEMDAYVALRMVDRPGPGSTRLLRSIVAEFAGFDAQFAERLTELDDEQLLSIRRALPALLAEDRERWRTLDWLQGSCSVVSTTAHVLHDCYLAQHANEFEKLDAIARIERRFWQACVKVMLPWLEQRRRPVLEVFMPQLRAIAAGDEDGKLRVPRGDHVFPLSPEEIELNNVVGMAHKKKLSVETDQQGAALTVCKAAKRVRDDIAHTRAPKAQDLRELISTADELLR